MTGYILRIGGPLVGFNPIDFLPWLSARFACLVSVATAALAIAKMRSFEYVRSMYVVGSLRICLSPLFWNALMRFVVPA